MDVSQKSKNRYTIYPSSSIPGYISEKYVNAISKSSLYSNAHSSIIYHCQDMGATNTCSSTDE